MNSHEYMSTCRTKCKTTKRGAPFFSTYITFLELIVRFHNSVLILFYKSMNWHEYMLMSRGQSAGKGRMWSRGDRIDASCTMTR